MHVFAATVFFALSAMRKQLRESEANNNTNPSKRQRAESPTDLTSQAKFLQSRGKTDAALSLLDTALELDPKNVDALVQKAFCCGVLGRWPEQALGLNPSDKAHLLVVAEVFKLNGNLKKCIAILKQILSHDPEFHQAKYALAMCYTEFGVKLKSEGNLKHGLDKIRKATKFCPNYAPAYFNMGVIFQDLREWNEAHQHYIFALNISPDYTEALCNLGVVCRAMGKLVDALNLFQRTLALNPLLDGVKSNMAEVMADFATHVKVEGNTKEAQRLYKEALLLDHKCWNAHYNLGVLYAEKGKQGRAEFCYRLAAEFNPGCSMAWNNLGVIEKMKGNLPKAIEFYLLALKANPKYAQTMNNLGVVYLMQGKLDEARHYLGCAINEDPNFVEAYNNLGIVYRDESEIEKSISCYEKCLSLDIHSKNAGHNKLLAMNYLDFDREDMMQSHDTWARHFSSQYEQYTHWDNVPSPTKKIVIGYISPDYFVHSVSYFIESVLKNYSKEKFVVICYSNVSNPDKKTQKLQKYVDSWRDIVNKNSKEVAEQIRSDKVDILVELTGHTAGNRLDVMAHKPAPVQITWIGYPNTTGLKTIDYRFTDVNCDPLDSTQYYSEELVRLKTCFLCYTPTEIPAPPPPVPLPCLTQGFITFGTFNNLPKMTTKVFQTWAKILSLVPNSRMVLKSKGFGSQTVKKNILGIFQKFGVESHRIDLLPLVDKTVDHLSTYSLMDLSLDTFPYAGTTTTCEALYMGVPVVTLSGKFHANNVGVSLLRQIEGHEKFIANTEEEYVKIAVDLANNIPLLSEIRATLRRKMEESYLMNAPKFTENLEEVYRQLWTCWCKKQPQPTSSSSVTLSATTTSAPSPTSVTCGDTKVAPVTASLSSTPSPSPSSTPSTTPTIPRKRNFVESMKDQSRDMDSQNVLRNSQLLGNTNPEATTKNGINSIREICSEDSTVNNTQTTSTASQLGDDSK